MPGENQNPTATSKLLDEEARTEAERRAKIGRVAKEIEDILLREDFSMGELAEVLDLFNARAHSVFSKTKIKSIKESYGKV